MSRHPPHGAATCHPKWRAASRADFLNPNLNLITRTRRLLAETRDLKKGPQQAIRFPVSLCSFVFPTANR